MKMERKNEDGVKVLVENIASDKVNLKVVIPRKAVRNGGYDCREPYFQISVIIEKEEVAIKNCASESICIVFENVQRKADGLYYKILDGLFFYVYIAPKFWD